MSIPLHLHGIWIWNLKFCTPSSSRRLVNWLVARKTLHLHEKLKQILLFCPHFKPWNLKFFTPSSSRRLVIWVVAHNTLLLLLQNMLSPPNHTETMENEGKVCVWMGSLLWIERKIIRVRTAYLWHRYFHHFWRRVYNCIYIL